MSALGRWLTFLRLAWGKPTPVVLSNRIAESRARLQAATRRAVVEAAPPAERIGFLRTYGDVQ